MLVTSNCQYISGKFDTTKYKKRLFVTVNEMAQRDKQNLISHTSI